jgi:inositol oxygenase
VHVIRPTDHATRAELVEWDDFVARRYHQGKGDIEFRNYRADANPTVTEFYRLNHANQTLDFVLKKKAEFASLTRGKKSVWEMADYLNTLVDDSDPDTDVAQIEHLLQTSEAIRKDGQPRWFVLTGFMHDQDEKCSTGCASSIPTISIQKVSSGRM